VIILDENIKERARERLTQSHIPVHQIGYDIGHKGLQDEEIIPFLCRLRRPTFFTEDADFYKRTLTHTRYCLVYLAVEPSQVAEFVRRVLRHPEFNTEAKRMSAVIRASTSNLAVWRLHSEKEINILWPPA
jgi:predicted nuclease of predicted toxin-antitoxin system